jgi:hypothetical protein
MAFASTDPFLRTTLEAIGSLAQKGLTGDHAPTHRIVRCTFDELREKRESNLSRVSAGRWVHQGMRHSFCSYWLNALEDVNKLLLMSGHTSPQIMWRRYFRAVPKAEAEKFFSILP